jgi:hypothetical protein
MRNGHRTRTSPVQRRVLLALAMIVSLSTLAPVFTASATSVTEHHPTGSFARFSDCPLSSSVTWKCFVDETTGGVLTLGGRAVPIVKTIVVRGGMSQPTKRVETIIPAEDGNTMSKTTLPVPGGLLGLIAPTSLPSVLRATFEDDIDKGLTGVTSTVELANPTNPGTISEYDLANEEGTALRIPLRVKLSNPFLGSTCYIGTPTNPLVLSMTTGTTSPPPPNKPLTGTSGSGEFSEESLIATITGDSLVDNAFSAPAATGCGGTSGALIDTAIDTAIGLPSPEGHNTAILDGHLTLATAEAVREHE